ncbi:hypothetical protein IX51_00265 [uncultured archaeon]|nr:hypothetical protein IX51_00265 [uncultured archaeon]HKJ96554.1 hypothetical protein [Thermoplasmataceae archaeon]
MEELVKLTIAVSIPVWGALAIIGAFAAYFAGVAGVGIIFILVIVVSAFWSRTLQGFAETVHRKPDQTPPVGPHESRLRDIEAKLDEISRNMKE